jgi:hypothetical protein
MTEHLVSVLDEGLGSYGLLPDPEMANTNGLL